MRSKREWHNKHFSKNLLRNETSKKEICESYDNYIKIRWFWLVKQSDILNKTSTFKNISLISQLISKSYIDPMTLLNQWKLERESLRPPFWNIAVVHFPESHVESGAQRTQYHEGHEILEFLLKQIQYSST